ncbi:MAG: OmpA family protein [Pseudomonadota bacterium]
MIRRLTLVCVLVASPLLAQDLSLPGNAVQLSARVSTFDSYELPVAPYRNGEVPHKVLEGQVDRKSWRISGASGTPLQVLEPLRRQLTDQGYEILLDCKAQRCGGFDFRFGTEVIPSPNMFVAIRDYRFLSAVRGEESISLLISRSGSDIYIQMIHVSPVPDAGPDRVAPRIDTPQSPEESETVGISALLERDGRVILGDLEFRSGSAQLGDGPFDTLEMLAKYLAATPSLRIALVGHTDSVGAPEANIQLSERRATAVRDYMVNTFQSDPNQIEANGVGYLSPISTNLTNDGRNVNRRVEAVLLSK